MKISHAIEICRAPDIVFDYIRSPEKAMQWMTSVVEGEIYHETENFVGTTFREVIADKTGRYEMQGEITRFVPDTSIAFHLWGRYNEVHVQFTVDAVSGGSRLTQEATIRFRGIMKIIAFLFGRSIRKSIRRQSEKEFSTLKELCEEQ